MSLYSKFEKRAMGKIFSERVLKNVKGLIILTSKFQCPRYSLLIAACHFYLEGAVAGQVRSTVKLKTPIQTHKDSVLNLITIQ